MQNRKSLKDQLSGLKMNMVIRTLAAGDSFVWFGWFLFNSIVAIHLVERLGVHAIAAIATGSAIYLGTRGLLQIPFSMYMDSNRSYHDEIYAMLLGGFIMSFSFLGYEFV
ncbi:hypothetical protein H6763_00260 [Candidatus Nomurabacteria bacterium]|nr:hypothetical protein [Candidatus Nomurabacteria bacterium]MCB9803248.1 hypothetical protein [Candidatus Nomurabacteria bacterium]